MRPREIKMQYFAKYHEASVDLSPVSLAVIVGKNGSGKSSLVDAITIALYGEGTRGGVRDLDNYVTRGRDEFTIQLPFEIGDKTYRVIRSHSKKRNKTNLDFCVWSGAEWVDMVEKTTGRTNADVQAKINEVLRIDYKTFVSSSIILQGQSGAFTAMTDAGRKEAFCKILGLDIWDRMLDITKDKQKELRASVKDLEDKEQGIAAVAEGKPRLIDSLATLTAKIDVLALNIENVESTLATYRASAGQEPVLRSSLTEIDNAIASQNRIVEGNNTQITRADKQIKEDEEKVNDCQKVLGRREEVEAAVKADAELAEELARQDTKAREYSTLNDKAINIERGKAKWDKETEKEIAGVEARIESAKKQTSVMSQVPCVGDTKNSCPLLAGAKKAADGLIVLEWSLNDYKAKINPHIESWQTALKERDAVGYDQGAHDLFKRQLTETRKVSSLKSQLDSATVRVEDLTKKIAELRESILDLQKKNSEANAEISNLQKRKEEIMVKLDGLKEIVDAINGSSEKLTDLRNQQTDANTEIGRVKLSLEQAEKSEIELGVVREKLQVARDDLAVQDVLSQACNKKGGVPALILENAVPEVERLANNLLDEMTGGRFAVRIDTQVIGKSTHEAQEAFQITVLDCGVDGPYETYSGAERFMIDLSLRVAISKFLAHRAGAEIRLLVLDEGLGACDDDNQQAVMDAIRKVSEEFAITLVITHIEKLQDEFTQRIDVTKDADGSKVKVVA